MQNNKKLHVIIAVLDAIFCALIALIFLFNIRGGRSIDELDWPIWLLMIVSMIGFWFTLFTIDKYVIYYRALHPKISALGTDFVGIILKIVLILLAAAIVFGWCQTDTKSLYSTANTMHILRMYISEVIVLVIIIPVVIFYLLDIRSVKKTIKNAKSPPVSLIGVTSGLIILNIVFLNIIYPSMYASSMSHLAKTRTSEIEKDFWGYDGCPTKNISIEQSSDNTLGGTIEIAIVGPCTEESALIAYGYYSGEAYIILPREHTKYVGTFDYNPVAELENSIVSSSTHQQSNSEHKITYIIAEDHDWDAFLASHSETILSYLSRQDTGDSVIIYLFDNYNGRKEELKSALFPNSKEFKIKNRLIDITKAYDIELVGQKFLKCTKLNDTTCEFNNMNKVDNIYGTSF